jgi:hypothetical protein
LESDTFGLDLLQPVEIPQNRQRFLWKYLEKKGLDLEILGKSLEESGPPGASKSSIMLGAAGIQTWPHLLGRWIPAFAGGSRPAPHP